MSYSPESANNAWVHNLQRIIANGSEHSPRGKLTREIICNTSYVDMQYPVVTVSGRKMGYKFLFAEAIWILSGDNRVDTIAPFSKAITNFSDDGLRFQGAYGPKVSEQLRYVVDTLVHDRDSRQAVLTVWRENPRYSKDVPCTIALQFLIRDNRIHCVATMRSSDIWLGWVYDVFNFTMIATEVGIRVRNESKQPLELGTLHLTAGSQHLYETDRHSAVDIFQGNETWSYEALSLSQFNIPQDLMIHLYHLRDRQWDDIRAGGPQFMRELEAHVRA